MEEGGCLFECARETEEEEDVEGCHGEEDAEGHDRHADVPPEEVGRAEG